MYDKQFEQGVRFAQAWYDLCSKPNHEVIACMDAFRLACDANFETARRIERSMKEAREQRQAELFKSAETPITFIEDCFE